MAAAVSSSIELFRALPAKLRKKFGYEDLELITGAASIKDRIQDFYRRLASEQRDLNMHKRKHGYCSAGKASCMTFVGKDAQFFTCAPCRKYNREMAKRERTGPGPVLSEYGQIRKFEREVERLERERAGR